MGCGGSKPDTFNIEEEFRKANWPIPEAKAFENEFEKEAYLTANVLRHNPKALINHIKEVKSKYNSRFYSYILKIFSLLDTNHKICFR
jgi:hypothetical protein